MSRDVTAPALREVRRGECPDEIQLVTDDGSVLIVHAHGLHDDERFRVREQILMLLRSVAARHG